MLKVFYCFITAVKEENLAIIKDAVLIVKMKQTASILDYLTKGFILDNFSTWNLLRDGNHLYDLPLLRWASFHQEFLILKVFLDLSCVPSKGELDLQFLHNSCTDFLEFHKPGFDPDLYQESAQKQFPCNFLFLWRNASCDVVFARRTFESIKCLPSYIFSAIPLYPI